MTRIEDYALATVDAVQRELTQDGLVLRYRTDGTNDGLPAGGREKDAIGLFERLLALRNDVGLLSVEWDPVTRRQLGNTAQAFSHFALVVSALQLHHQRPHRSDEPIRPSVGGPLTDGPPAAS
jgi:GH15 family glucan-1,4-alpha-glucosidase